MPTPRRLAAGIVIVLAVLAPLLATSKAAATQTARYSDIERRDELIAAQQALISVYRCKYEIDVDAVPGGCHDGWPVDPPVKPAFDGLPTIEEISDRDYKIAANRYVINLYRCALGVDTPLVPWSCSDGWRATPADDRSGDAELSPVEVYEQISPSIALVETPSKFGSGVLIEGGYIVTNHHVVRPHEEAWVVFPDGTELEGVPVVGWDFMADLAVLGPVEVSAPPVRLGSELDLPPGSELLMLGYPAEPEFFPEPTITRGILSRVREWDAYGLTVLQSDSAIAGGQSGGALLNAQGELVGISTWRFSDAGFALSTSFEDDSLIVERLILNGLVHSHMPSDQKSTRRAPRGVGEFTHTVSGTPGFDSPAFTFDASAGTKVTVRINGPQDGVIVVSDSVRTIETRDSSTGGIEQTTFEVLRDGLHFVRIDSKSEGHFTFELSSSVRLNPFDDVFDGTAVAVERTRETLYGYFDYPRDIDWYKISLEEDETIEINTDAIVSDTAIAVRNPETDELVKSDGADPLTGLGFSQNAQLRFTAPSTGKYYIYVEETSGKQDKGYVLTVERLRQ